MFAGGFPGQPDPCGFVFVADIGTYRKCERRWGHPGKHGDQHSPAWMRRRWHLEAVRHREAA